MVVFHQPETGKYCSLNNKFTTLFMITLEDFIETIRENKNDYVIYKIIKDNLTKSLKISKNFKNL